MMRLLRRRATSTFANWLRDGAQVTSLWMLVVPYVIVGLGGCAMKLCQTLGI